MKLFPFQLLDHFSIFFGKVFNENSNPSFDKSHFDCIPVLERRGQRTSLSVSLTDTAVSIRKRKE